MIRPTTRRAPERSGGEERPRDRTLARLLGHVRGLMPADGVAFLGLDGELVAEWFASPDLREALATATGLADLVLERDRSLLLPRVEAWEAAHDLKLQVEAAHVGPRAERTWSVFREASLIACPVKTEIGTALGVLVVASLDSARPLAAGELRVVEVIADLGALALQRAELLEDEGRRASEERLLKRAGAEVSGSLELEEVYSQIVRHAAAATGATKALLTRLDARASVLRPAASVDFSEGFQERRLPLDRGMLGQVARRRKPYLSPAVDADRWEGGVFAQEGIRSFMHAPIELGPRLFGVLTVAHPEPGRFGEEQLELLVKLARSCAAGIANAIDFDRERRIARALTLGFVPESLPEVAGYDTGLLYAPAANEPTGGDVYGAWGLPDGEVALLIGDVAGKGVETAATSAMVRFFVEARSWDSASPATVLSQTNEMLLSRLPPDTFVTAFLGILSPGRVRFCNAGHLPPLLVGLTGEAQPITGGGLPLGIDDTPDYTEQDLRLAPGDILFGYTDGLIEARHGEELYGLERLRLLVASHAGEEPEQLVHSVHDEVVAWADGLADDAVALALKRHG